MTLPQLQDVSVNLWIPTQEVPIRANNLNHLNEQLGGALRSRVDEMMIATEKAFPPDTAILEATPQMDLEVIRTKISALAMTLLLCSLQPGDHWFVLDLVEPETWVHDPTGRLLDPQRELFEIVTDVSHVFVSMCVIVSEAFFGQCFFVPKVVEEMSITSLHSRVSVHEDYFERRAPPITVIVSRFHRDQGVEFWSTPPTGLLISYLRRNFAVIISNKTTNAPRIVPGRTPGTGFPSLASVLFDAVHETFMDGLVQKIASLETGIDKFALQLNSDKLTARDKKLLSRHLRQYSDCQILIETLLADRKVLVAGMLPILERDTSKIWIHDAEGVPYLDVDPRAKRRWLAMDANVKDNTELLSRIEKRLEYRVESFGKRLEIDTAENQTKTLEQSFNSSFKTAASTITQLYVQGLRTNKLSYSAGYEQALLDVWNQAAALARGADGDEMVSEGGLNNGIGTGAPQPQNLATMVVGYAELVAWIKRRYDEGGGNREAGANAGGGLGEERVDSQLVAAGTDSGRTGHARQASHSCARDGGGSFSSAATGGMASSHLGTTSNSNIRALVDGGRSFQTNINIHSHRAPPSPPMEPSSSSSSPPDLAADTGEDEVRERDNGDEDQDGNSADWEKDDGGDERGGASVQALSSLSLSTITNPTIRNSTSQLSNTPPRPPFTTRPVSRRIPRPASSSASISSPSSSASLKRRYPTPATLQRISNPSPSFYVPVGSETPLQVQVQGGFSFLGKSFAVDAGTGGGVNVGMDIGVHGEEGPATKRGRWGNASGIGHQQQQQQYHLLQPSAFPALPPLSTPPPRTESDGRAFSVETSVGSVQEQQDKQENHHGGSGVFGFREGSSSIDLNWTPGVDRRTVGGVSGLGAQRQELGVDTGSNGGFTGFGVGAGGGRGWGAFG
ncbi:hypothetical protein HDU93_008173 [Gonapodya sp. JEL0774]|nr:hypothetical protein HDU93_008173 [Gonapodya sp. JEL0774]